MRHAIIATTNAAVGVLLATALLVAVPAEAQQTADQYCNEVAHYAEAVAKDRDNGTPEYIAIDIASRQSDPAVRSDLIFVVQFVHNPPYQAPGQEATYAFDFCWAVYGGR